MATKKNSKKDKAKKVTAVALAAALLFTGTWAWQSMSQNAYNQASKDEKLVGARLHNDFFLTEDGSKRLQSDASTYVENYMNGGVGVIARVMIREYMEIGTEAGLGIDDTIINRIASKASGKTNPNLKAVIEGTEANDSSKWIVYKFDDDETKNPIRKYLGFAYGGQKTYMPTFNQVRDTSTKILPKADGESTTFTGVDISSVGTATKVLVDAVDINGTIYGDNTVFDPTLPVTTGEGSNQITINKDNVNKYAGKVDASGNVNENYLDPSRVDDGQRYIEYVSYKKFDGYFWPQAGKSIYSIDREDDTTYRLGTAEYTSDDDYTAYAGTPVTDPVAEGVTNTYVNEISNSINFDVVKGTDTFKNKYVVKNAEKGVLKYITKDGEYAEKEDVYHYAKDTNVPKTGIANNGVISIDTWKTMYTGYATSKGALQDLIDEKTEIEGHNPQTEADTNRLAELNGDGTEANPGEIATKQAEVDEKLAEITGDFWVYDKDGWAYYAKQIEPYTATSLLTNHLTEGAGLKDLAERWHYMMDVHAQFASPEDIGDAQKGEGFRGFFDKVASGEGESEVSESAIDLLKAIGAQLPDQTMPTLNDLLTPGATLSVSMNNVDVNGNPEDLILSFKNQNGQYACTSVKRKAPNGSYEENNEYKEMCSMAYYTDGPTGATFVILFENEDEHDTYIQLALAPNANNYQYGPEDSSLTAVSVNGTNILSTLTETDDIFV